MIEAALRIRRQIERDVFDYPALSRGLAGYRKPRDKITKLLADGTIIRIRKGLYCFGEDFRKGPISREYLANLIYGPSYVSLEYALSLQGLIPERVEVVTSVALKRSRCFRTPFGTFSYRQLTVERYASGAVLQQSGNAAFLVATAEKAVIDKAWADRQDGRVRETEAGLYLGEELRIDPDALANLDLDRLRSLSSSFDSAWIDELVESIRRSRGALHA